MIKIGMFISDRYEIIEKVGSGGMADVYKAKDHRLNRYVAIKVLKQEYSTDTKFLTKFRAEAQSVAGLSHSNIVGVYDVGEENGLHYIVMELVEGITLKKYIERKGKLDMKEALGISIQIAQGLEAAHANHIIHRDIKPQNIIISREGRVKVTDFGIAKAASSNTITSNAMGSVHYISPEQARGGFNDEKSDIYSLGITMYEMISGTVPFTGDSTVAVALAHIQEEAVPLAQLDSRVPKSIDMIVSKCIQKKPELRYLSATELIEDLKHAVTDPDGDFVRTTPLVNIGAPTIPISDEELQDIRKGVKPAVVVTKPDPEEDLDLADIEEDKENDSDIDPKLEKAVVIGSIAAGVILGLIVIVIVCKFFFFSGGGSDDAEASAAPSAQAAETAEPGESTSKPGNGIELDDLSGMGKQEAINYLKGLDIDVSIATEERASEDVEKDTIINTNPVAGNEIFDGDTVTLIISTGKATKPVPDVSGKTVDEAKKLIEDQGFTTKLSYANSDDVEIEKVIGTQPAKDSEAEEGSEINIIVSKGKATTYVKVPKLNDLTEKKAKKALEALGLKLGTVTSNNSDTVAAKTVMGQSQPAGTEVETGTKVDITISLGPEIKPKYIGNITITQNPFTDETQSGTVKLVLNQDGTTKVVGDGEQVMTYVSFPLSLQVEGFSESEGEIVMYVNGVRFNAYNISFTKVLQ